MAEAEKRAGPRRPFTAVVRGVTRPVVPHQLKAELRAHLDDAGKQDVPADIWTSVGANGTTVVLADVDQADLETVLSAHVSDPLYGAPPELTKLAALAGKPEWTQEDLDAALRAVVARLLG